LNVASGAHRRLHGKSFRAWSTGVSANANSLFRSPSIIVTITLGDRNQLPLVVQGSSDVFAFPQNHRLSTQRLGALSKAGQFDPTNHFRVR